MVPDGSSLVLLLALEPTYKMFRNDSILTYRQEFGEQMQADYQDGIIAIKPD